MLWDSAFHALAWNLYDGRMAQKALWAILLQAHKDGFVPHQAGPGGHSQLTKLPLLAWAVWEVTRAHGDRAFAARALPILGKYLLWD